MNSREVPANAHHHKSQVTRISRVICACAVRGIRTHNLKPRANLPYHLTYTTHVMELDMVPSEVTRGEAFSTKQ